MEMAMARARKMPVMTMPLTMMMMSRAGRMHVMATRAPFAPPAAPKQEMDEILCWSQQ